MEFQPGASCSWIIRTIFKNRDVICQTEVWNKMHIDNKFPTGKLYKEL